MHNKHHDAQKMKVFQTKYAKRVEKNVKMLYNIGNLFG